MKTQLLFTAALVVCVLGPTNAAEKELSKHQAPKAVVEAFEKDYPKAKEVEFEKETFGGKPAYEVEYKENGREYEVLYNAEGTVLQREEIIEVQALPEPVSQAVMKARPKGKIKEAEKVMAPDGTLTGYEVEIKENGKKLEYELDPNGKILKTERD